MSRVRLQRSEAIVLNRHDYGEADRILTLYTRDRGKVSAIAKGVRRIASRMAGHIELFTHGEFLLARGRNLEVLTQASTVHAERGLREDLVRATYAYHAAEMVDRFCAASEPSPAIFELLRDTLRALGSAEDPSVVIRWFELRLLGLLGYRPELYRCPSCNLELNPEGNAFSPEEGGVLCPACAKPARDALALSGGAFRVLRFLQTRDLATARRIALNAATRAELEQLAHAHVRHVLERDLKSVDFLDRLRQIGRAVAAPAPALSHKPAGDEAP